MTRRFPLAHVVVAAAVVTMIGLGVWQMSRAGEKDALIARYAAAAGKPEMGFPTFASKGELPLFRKARGQCLEVTTMRTASGASAGGEPGFLVIADCRTGAEGPGMAVVLGWSKNPQARTDWKGGEVSGIIGPDRTTLLRLVADQPAPGLEAAAAPSLSAIPNNHRGYALQWFFFAAAALVIYGLARRSRRTP